MKYALIQEGRVVNVIWLYPGNAADFPNAAKVGDLAVGIGDTYEDGCFYKDGQLVKSDLQLAEEVIAQLDAAIVELEYTNVLLELGIE